MTYGSCRFLFHQFIQRDKAHEIINGIKTVFAIKQTPQPLLPLTDAILIYVARGETCSSCICFPCFRMF